MQTWRLIRCGLALLSLLASMVVATVGLSQTTRDVHVLQVQGVIGPATSDYLLQGLASAVDEHAQLIVLALDTPGGLDPSMRAMVQAILASPVPVATYVSPSGARAASAGTFILYASHIAAMAPASNLGAASPVAIGIGGASDPDAEPFSQARTAKNNTDKEAEKNKEGEGNNDKPTQGKGRGSSDVMAGKVSSDAAAYIRSLAQLRGRNIDFAQQAVMDARSLSAQEALDEGVIEYIASDLTDLLTQLDGRTVRLQGDSEVVLDTKDARVITHEPGWRTKVLSVLTNPQLAVVLMMVGIYGLFFELTSPGFALPGVAGLICLLLGLYAFHLLPVNWAGVGLLFLGAVLMIAEAFVPSFGVLGVGGVVAFVLGGLFLTDTDIPGFDLSLPFLIGFGVASALLLAIGGTMAGRAYRQRVVTGYEAMIGLEGVVQQVHNGDAYAAVRGEQWRVVSDEGLSVGDRVRVTAIHGLTLNVVLIK